MCYFPHMLSFTCINCSFVHLSLLFITNICVLHTVNITPTRVNYWSQGTRSGNICMKCDRHSFTLCGDEKESLQNCLHAKSPNQTVHLHTKFHRNRMIRGWALEKKPISKWRPSAILDFFCDIIILHPGTIVYVPNTVLNFLLHWFGTFSSYLDFHVLAFWL